MCVRYVFHAAGHRFNFMRCHESIEGRISCVIWMSRNDIKWKYIFMFPLKHLARKRLMGNRNKIYQRINESQRSRKLMTTRHRHAYVYREFSTLHKHFFSVFLSWSHTYTSLSMKLCCLLWYDTLCYNSSTYAILCSPLFYIWWRSDSFIADVYCSCIFGGLCQREYYIRISVNYLAIVSHVSGMNYVGFCKLVWVMIL